MPPTDAPVEDGHMSRFDDAVRPGDKAPNKFVAFWRRVYRPMGFQKGYNFPLFIIFAGAMLGFVFARLSYLNVAGSAPSSFASGASPGEWYWFHTGIYRIGITIHLGTILPAGFLMVWQFVPVIRHKLLLFHRINGYIVILLVFVSNVSAVIICRRAFGGTLDTQAVVGALAIMSTVSIALAYYNIKRLQIDQHRAWMLRAMFYLGTIITARLIMFISANIISLSSTYYTTMSCGEIRSIYGSSQAVQGLYPQCGPNGSALNGVVVVKADFDTNKPEQIGASLRISFGMALWMSLLLHAAGVEIYLALTPRESNRLRQVSYERQMERGIQPFGSAGLFLGDVDEWKPSSEAKMPVRGKESISSDASV